MKHATFKDRRQLCLGSHSQEIQVTLRFGKLWPTVLSESRRGRDRDSERVVVVPACESQLPLQAGVLPAIECSTCARIGVVIARVTITKRPDLIDHNAYQNNLNTRL